MIGAHRTHGALDLPGLAVGPAQTWGAVRLVPLLRPNVREDLRLALRDYEQTVTLALLDGRPGGPGHGYVSFVPHALVVSWSEDGSPVAAFGASMRAVGPDPAHAAKRRSAEAKRASAKDGVSFGRAARVVHRMAKREADRRLRVLPLHLAMEGFMAMCFGGPEIAWEEYSQRARRKGLSPRTETSWPGASIAGLEDALRVFEIHEGQTGVMAFVADALASVFVVPHPDDYRALHRSLLEDFFGELLHRYGLLYPDVAPAFASGQATSATADLRGVVARMRSEWADFGAHLAAGALGRPITIEDRYRLGPFRLQTFGTSLDLHEENHIGERIVSDDGDVQYMKTFRLSDAQARRAYLLSVLAENDWSLELTAKALRGDVDDLVKRLENAGFGYLLAPHVRAAAKRR